MRMKALSVLLLAFCMAALPTRAGQNQNQSSSPVAPPDQHAASSQPAPTEPEQQHKPELAHPVETVTEAGDPRRGWWQRLIQS